MRWPWWKRRDARIPPAESWRVTADLPDGTKVLKGSGLSRDDAIILFNELAAGELNLTLAREKLIAPETP